MATILVVDDSATQRFQLRHDLEQIGHKVIDAVDGQVGLDVLKKTTGIDLILCDVNMPHMDGLSMCAKIKELGIQIGVPIFMLTTEASTEMKDAAKKAGVLGWFMKPYHKEKLLAAVEKVLKK